MKRFPIFFDSEFSALDESASLISIGFVAKSGATFYAELPVDPEKCSEFVRESVLPLLDGGSSLMFSSELAARLKAWIEGFKGEVVLVSDAPKLDWPWVYDLFEAHGWPNNLQKQCEPIQFWIPKHSEEVFHCALEEYWLEHESKRHHALIDAMSLFEGCNAVRIKQEV